jgi:putative phosphoesterase
MKIGILSDTHGYLHPRLFEFFDRVDEIWHAGDIGTLKVFETLQEFKSVKAVYGNIDSQEIRNHCPEVLVFNEADIRMLMTHIGGHPGKYVPVARRLIEQERPGIVVCGHSHILRIQYDKEHELLFINPGAAGKFGSHRSITAVRFRIENALPSAMEVLDIPK